MNLYRDILYPLKKIMSGASVTRFNREYWDLFAENDKRHSTQFEAYSRKNVESHWKLVEPLLPHKPLVIIDLGCGTGMALSHYSDIMGDRLERGIGIDISSKILKIAQERNSGFEYWQRDLLDTENGNPADRRAEADFLYSHAVLQSIPKKSLDLFFQQVRGLLKKGGIFLLAWWAPYYWDEKWVVRFVPNSHRHFRSTVQKALSRHFDLIEIPLVRVEPERRAEGWIIQMERAVMKSAHPREVGLILGVAK